MLPVREEVKPYLIIPEYSSAGRFRAEIRDAQTDEKRAVTRWYETLEEARSEATTLAEVLYDEEGG